MELQIRYLGKSEKLSTRILLEGSSGNIGGIIGEQLRKNNDVTQISRRKINTLPFSACCFISFINVSADTLSTIAV